MSTDSYTAENLETAACLWEAVCDMERDGCERAGDEEQETRGAQIRTCRETIGTAALRSTVVGWVPLVEAAWIIADTDPANGERGHYGEPFDWGFVPGWIARNVDWSHPRYPTANQLANEGGR